jgi:hypothetical protein
MLLILVHNDGTGSEETGNYDYEVRINNEVIERGRIQGHNRKDGWRALIKEIANHQQTSPTDPNQETIDFLITQARQQAKTAGLKPLDIDRAVDKAREP